MLHDSLTPLVAKMVFPGPSIVPSGRAPTASQAEGLQPTLFSLRADTKVLDRLDFRAPLRLLAHQSGLVGPTRPPRQNA